MRYFLIAGEASGDLHAAHLMRAIAAEDPQAEFRFYGGDAMQSVGGTLLRHYRTLAYMGFIPVLRHLPEILRGMRQCRDDIRAFAPDAVVLVDYPGFNLRVARYVSREGLCPVFYYISPKIWAWKSWRIRQIRRYVTRLYSILPFEPAWFAARNYKIEYVGNPTLDEVAAYEAQSATIERDETLVALLPGSRQQELTANLPRMLQACRGLSLADGRPVRLAIAKAPALPQELYDEILRQSNTDAEVVEGNTFNLLNRSATALVTSGTATLETALLHVPQVVCYYVGFGRFIRLMKQLVLSVRYISLVNLIAEREVVPELIGDHMNPARLHRELQRILPGGSARQAQLDGYDELRSRLGQTGAPQHAAHDIVKRLKNMI